MSRWVPWLRCAPTAGSRRPSGSLRAGVGSSNAGLDLLGGESDPDDLTVRAICRRAGLTVRYFYESFADKDEFVARFSTG